MASRFNSSRYGGMGGFGRGSGVSGVTLSRSGDTVSLPDWYDGTVQWQEFVGGEWADMVGETGTSVSIGEGERRRARLGGGEGFVTAVVRRPAAIAAPVVTGSLDDIVATLGEGPWTFDASTVFSGESLSYSVSGAGATIDSETGIGSVPDGTERDGVVVTVTATNAGGSKNVAFQVTLEEAAPPPNEEPVATDDTLTTTAGETVRISFAGTDADGGDLDLVEAPVATSGSFSNVDLEAMEADYTAPASAGSDTITFTLTDGEDESTGTIAVTVEAAAVEGLTGATPTDLTGWLQPDGTTPVSADGDQIGTMRMLNGTTLVRHPNSTAYPTLQTRDGVRVIDWPGGAAFEHPAPVAGSTITQVARIYIGEAQAGVEIFMGSHGTSNEERFYLLVRDGVLEMSVGTEPGTVIEGVDRRGQYVIVAVRANDTTKQAALFVNGALAGSGTFTGPAFATHIGLGIGGRITQDNTLSHTCVEVSSLYSDVITGDLSDAEIIDIMADVDELQTPDDPGLPVGDPTPTTMQTSVTDAETDIEYHFVDASGNPEQREVGQYWDGKWFVVGGTGNPVRIGRMVPEAAIIDTSSYTRPNDNQDWEAYGSSSTDRMINGAEINPNQGEIKPGRAAYDSYITGKSNIRYDHSRNVDPAANEGAPAVLEEGSVVKAVSIQSEGGHTDDQTDKTRIQKWACLTVVPEVPVANSFRPPVRGTDKRSYWTTDMIDWSKRSVIPGFQPMTVSALQAENARRKHLQPTFVFADEENTRRWNPGAHGYAFEIYGNGWYEGWEAVFRCFHGDYAQSEIEEGVCATIQCGIDLYGHQADNGFISGHYAHHAGRKGLVHMAGHLLNDPDILAICTYAEDNNRFGVDDGMSGYVNEEIINRPNQPNFGGRDVFMPKFGPEWLGKPAWTSYFAPFDAPNVSGELNAHIQGPDLNHFYRVLSQEKNGKSALVQALWGMVADPDANIWNPAHFDYIDAYLAIRFGDFIDGAWTTTGSGDDRRNVFWGNWSDAGSTSDYQAWKTLRDHSARPIYRGAPEALPTPLLTETSEGIEVRRNPTSDFLSPQDKDAAIVDFDVRYVAYPDGALEVTDPSSDNRLYKMDWREIPGVYLDTETPVLIPNPPGGYRIIVQIRANNIHGKGVWDDWRYAIDYGEEAEPPNGVAGFNPDRGLFALPGRWVTMMDVSSALARTPMCWRAPTTVPSVGVTTGTVLTTDGGYWTGAPTFSYEWRVSSDGFATYDVVGTGASYTVAAADQGKEIAVSVTGSNAEGTGETSAGPGTLVVAPMILDQVDAGTGNTFVYDGNALGGGHFIVSLMDYDGGPDPLTLTMTVGATTVPVDVATPHESNVIVFSINVPEGETATEFVINGEGFSASRCRIYRLSGPVTLKDVDDNYSDTYHTFHVDVPTMGVAIGAARGGTGTLTGGDLTEDWSAEWGFFASADSLSGGEGSVSMSVSWGTNFQRGGALLSYEVDAPGYVPTDPPSGTLMVGSPIEAATPAEAIQPNIGDTQGRHFVVAISEYDPLDDTLRITAGGGSFGPVALATASSQDSVALFAFTVPEGEEVTEWGLNKSGLDLSRAWVFETSVPVQPVAGFFEGRAPGSHYEATIPTVAGGLAIYATRDALDFTVSGDMTEIASGGGGHIGYLSPTDGTDATMVLNGQSGGGASLVAAGFEPA